MIFTAGFHDDPYPAYRWLREHAPCHHEPDLGFYALSRYADVVAALRRHSLFSSSGGRPAASPAPSLLFMDPPGHGRLRRVVSGGFTPRAVRRMEAAVRDIVVGRLARLAERGGGDFTAELAAPLAHEVVMRLLGVPDGDRATVRSLLSAPPSPQAAAELGAYWRALCAAARTEAGEGMVAGLVRPRRTAASAGPGPLTDDQVAAFCSLVAQAGTESVAMLLSNAMVLFARHPEQWRLVVERPETVPAAVEEVLRYWAPTQHQRRTLTAGTEIHGRRMPAGAVVVLLTGSASRDERAYPDPDTFDVTRFTADRHASAPVGFGFGAHFCLGAALARLQARVALREVAGRFPRFSVDEDGLVRSDAANGFGFTRVPVRL